MLQAVRSVTPVATMSWDEEAQLPARSSTLGVLGAELLPPVVLGRGRLQ